MSEVRSCINIGDQFWAKLQELKTNLEAFSPTGNWTFDEFVSERANTRDKIEILKRSITRLDIGRDNFGRISDLNVALRNVLDATDETKWLIPELRQQSNDSSRKVLATLLDMKIMVLNPGNKYYEFEYMDGPKQIHFLLSQLCALRD